MSIINDALKKTQDNMDNNDENDVSKIYEKLHPPKEKLTGSQGSPNTSPNSSKPAKKTTSQSVFFLIVLLIALAGVSYYYYGNLIDKNALAKVKRFFSSKTPQFQTKPTPTPIKQYEKNTLVLNGIMVEGDKSAALINGKIYEVNDLVEGKKITSITPKRVVLVDNEGEVTALAVP